MQSGLTVVETAPSAARPYRPISARLDRLYIRQPRIYLAVIVAAYLVVGSLFALRTPAWQNPDEPAHYNNIAYIAAGNGLPVLRHGDYNQAYQDALVAAGFPAGMPVDRLRYEAYQPPLYYVAMAPAFLMAQGSLAALRLLGVGLGAVVILLIFLCSEIVFPNKQLLTVGATAFAAFLPMQVAISAAVNNDGLAQVLLLAALLVLLRWMRRQFYARHGLPRLPDWPLLLLLGLLMGLGMLTKVYAYAALVLCAAAVGLTVWLQPRVGSLATERARSHGASEGRLMSGVLAGLLVCAPAILLALPFWVRNVQLYGAWDILGLRYHDAVVVGQPTTTAWLQQYGWIHFSDRAMTFTFRSFWGVFGWMGVFMDSRIYTILLIFSGAILSGLLWALVRFISGRPETDLDRFQFWVLGLYACFVLAVLATYVAYNAKFVQHQGRYLLWGLLPISTFVALGWRELMQPLQGKVTGFLLGLLAVALAAAALVNVTQDKLTLAVMGLMAALLFLQPFLLSGTVDAIIVGSPQVLQRWLRRPALRTPLAVARVLAWAAPFVLLFLLDLVIPGWYIGPQLVR